ncbi:MAG: transglutaminase-like domain-containing protein [Thermoproteota archaeon]
MSFKVPKVVGGWEAYYYKLKIIFANNGSSDYSFSLEDRLFFIFQNTSTQQALILEVNPRIKTVHRDVDGNLWAELDFPEKISPGEKITASIIVKVNLTLRNLPKISVDSSGSIFEIPMELANYTASSGVWMYDSTNFKYIADLAAQVKGNDTNVLRIISKMVRFIGERVEYPYGEELRPPQYPNQTLPSPELRGKGDCDDQSALLITMLRSVGIPSYLQTGGIVSKDYSTVGSTWNGHLYISSKGVGWHGWVEAYVPPWGWIPVDMTYGYSPDEPLYSISRSAPARELILESEKYSSIDFVAETRKMEEKVKNSEIYIYLDEEVSKAFPSRNREETGFLALLILAFVVYLLMLLTFRLLKEIEGKQ